jgi:hypothetical protein
VINYVEKGNGLHIAIGEAGYNLRDVNGVWQSSDDVAVQAIIDGYDPLPLEKEIAIERVKLEASKHAAVIYPFIDPESDQAIGLYNFAEDLYLATVAGSRETLSGRLLTFKGVHDTAVAAIADINSMTDWLLAQAYDEVNTPAW